MESHLTLLYTRKTLARKWAQFCVFWLWSIDNDTLHWAVRYPLVAATAYLYWGPSSYLPAILERYRYWILIIFEDDPKTAHPQSTLNACSRMEGRMLSVMCGILVLQWSDWSVLYPVFRCLVLLP